MALEQPDPAILRKAQRGDATAFATIVRAYKRPIFNYALRLLGDRALAEDMTQEVFIRIHQGLPGFSSKSKFTTWMFQITKYRLLDELRAIERRPRATISIDDVKPFAAHEIPSERAETIEALWAAITELPLELRAALLLRDVVGLSYNEIADSQQTTLSTVKWRIFTARKQVQIILARAGHDLATASPAVENTITA